MDPTSHDRCPHRDRGEKTWRREKSRDERGRDRGDAAASPGMPRALAAGRSKKDPPPEPPEGVWPCDRHLHLGLLPPHLEADRDSGRDKSLEAHTAVPGAQFEGVL